MNPQGFSTSDMRFSHERQVGLRKMDHVAAFSSVNFTASSPNMSSGFLHPNHHVFCGQNGKPTVGEHLVGAERVGSHSLPTSDMNALMTSNAEYMPSFFGDNKKTLKLSSNQSGYSNLITTPAAITSPYDDAFESLEKLEAQTIGDLLPDDDDLLSGVTDGFDTVARASYGEEREELDLFSSVGGLELGEDDISQRNIDLCDVNYNSKLAFSLGAIGGVHPLGERPSRTLFVRNVNSNVEDSELIALFEQYGDIRTLYTACKHRGFFMISYYDIRAACNAMRALQDKPLRCQKLDIHFSIPKENPSEKVMNQGILAIFNLDSSVTKDDLLGIFGVYGEVKEIRETPESHHRFVEFYDIREAESALHALNKSEIAGKQIILEPGGSKRFMQLLPSVLGKEESGILLQKQITSANLATSFSVSPPGSLSLGADHGKIFGLNSMNRGSVGPHTPSIADSGHIQNRLNFGVQGSPDFQAHSLPEYSNAFPNGLHLGKSPSNVPNGQSLDFQVFGSPASGNCPPGHTFMWNNFGHAQQQAVRWPSSPSFVNHGVAMPPQQLHAAVPRAPHILNSFLPLNNHHVGSAPSAHPNLWDQRHTHAGLSPDATVFHPGSLGNMRILGNSLHPLDFVPCNVLPHACANGMDMPIPSRSTGLHAHHKGFMAFPTRGQTLPTMNGFGSPNYLRNEGNMSHADNKKQFELDIDRIVRGEDKRTTLMIKNIPNKYTSKMLLAAIDETHKGAYDFIYLPIDFKNKCNVGYAFINMTEPSLIVPFSKTFNGKKWEKFNSEKVASLAYARIQGTAALVAHFQNSSLMNEDKRCRPMLFHTDGPNAGDQVPFPMGSNIRPRPGKLRISSSENQVNSFVGDDCLNGDSSSSSGKDSD